MVSVEAAALRTRTALLCAAVLGACNAVHDAPALSSQDCAACHAADYAATAAPVHRSEPALYHQRCIDCHSSESWSPALPGPHPEERFSITAGSGHVYACLDCHSLVRGGPSKLGADTDCVGCHTGAHSPEVALGRHRNIPSFELEEYVPNEPPWCMECHDGGRGFGKALPHPEASFVIERPPHDYECQECHDTTRGKVTQGNTNCTGCHDGDAHTEAAEVDNHWMVDDYVFDPDDPAFCLDCHAEVIPGLASVPNASP
jgi:hypothetical protein